MLLFKQEKHFFAFFTGQNLIKSTGIHFLVCLLTILKKSMSHSDD